MDWLADTIDLPLESSDEVPVQHMGLVELLKSLQMHPTVRGLYSEIDYTDASEVSARLTELLPFDNEVKQSFFKCRTQVIDSMSSSPKSQNFKFKGETPDFLSEATV